MPAPLPPPYPPPYPPSQVKLWDGRTSRCVRSISKAHEGATVGGMAFGGGGGYLLTWGDDRAVRLWDVSSAKEVRTYSMAGDDTEAGEAQGGGG